MTLVLRHPHSYGNQVALAAFCNSCSVRSFYLCPSAIGEGQPQQREVNRHGTGSRNRVEMAIRARHRRQLEYRTSSERLLISA